MKGAKREGANANFFQQKPSDNQDAIIVPKKGPAKAQAAMGGASNSNKYMDTMLTKAKQSGTLIVQNRGLKLFPSEILRFQDINVECNWWEGHDLTKIDLSNNDIPEIPEQIATQEFIQHLNINSNLLQSIPNSLYTLQSLKFLDISYNKISSLSESLGQCSSLVEFHSAGNTLTTLPRSLGSLTNPRIALLLNLVDKHIIVDMKLGF